MMRCSALLRCRATYEELFNRVLASADGVVRHLDLAALAAADGAPADPVDGLLAITQRTKAVLTDVQVAWFLERLYQDVWRGELPCLVGIGRGVQILSSAEAAGHLPAVQSYHKLMKLCFELRADDGRALILDLFHRLARRLRKTKISSHAAPTVEICLMRQC
eukprot:TRINITY_DN762_c0_g1_i9.p2 TRINITY_DN762_c0_g1~~TRINITY_DN762_c0_g1_i9.p2  ORF type:complete len:163 (+),score=30.55 TRINITY_DN762_c0_g1_i9:143-631(+)